MCIPLQKSGIALLNCLHYDPFTGTLPCYSGKLYTRYSRSKAKLRPQDCCCGVAPGNLAAACAAATSQFGTGTYWHLAALEMAGGQRVMVTSSGRGRIPILLMENKSVKMDHWPSFFFLQASSQFPCLIVALIELCTYFWGKGYCILN